MLHDVGLPHIRIATADHLATRAALEASVRLSQTSQPKPKMLLLLQLRAIPFQILGFLFVIPAAFFVLLRVMTKGWRKVFLVRDRPLPPKTLLDRRWGEHRHVHLPGLRMHYVEKGDRAKPLMLFLHGFPEFWFSWRHQIEYFAKDYWCVAPDLRGYGDTEKPAGRENYSMELLTSDVKNLVHALGREKCVLVGHDWGGAIGYLVCERYPELVSAYVACNAPHSGAMGALLRKSWEQRLRSWYIVYFQCPCIPEMFLRLGDLSTFDAAFGLMKRPMEEEALEAYKFTFKDKAAFTGPLNYYRNIFLGGFGAVSSSGRIRVPVLSIFGTADKYLSLDLVKETGKFVDDFTEKNVAGIGHWVQMDAADYVNRIMEEYLRDSDC